MDADASVAAVAFAQADEHANRRQASQQPAAGDVACYVPSFVGFACLIGDPCLLEVGGYRDEFIIHEERELCLRWLDRAGVSSTSPTRRSHVADSANRDVRTYIRHVIRNDCLNALCSEPAPRALVSIRSGC